MNFYDLYSKYKHIDCDSDLFPALLSPAAESLLEETASRAHELTLQNFGKTIQLYTPIYLSNYCENSCVYCGFNKNNDINRRKLTLEEVEREGVAVSSTGLRHVLLLTGGSKKSAPVSYIKECVKILKRYFSSVSLEIYALAESEYEELVKAGACGLTIYQEVYDEDIYEKVHPTGPKRNYSFRIGAPERAARRGMRSVNIGVLLGLGDWRREAFFMALHAAYLQDRFPETEVSISIPRMRPYAQTKNYKPDYEVSDKNVVQIIVAMRIFMPKLGITLSTRESPELRENLIPLGITRMSAGSKTSVGGHTIAADECEKSGQFNVFDRRRVPEIKEAIRKKGYQPVLKDWMRI